MWILTRLACARGQAKAFSINQDVSGSSLLQLMQHADTHSCLAAYRAAADLVLVPPFVVLSSGLESHFMLSGVILGVSFVGCVSR